MTTVEQAAVDYRNERRRSLISMLGLDPERPLAGLSKEVGYVSGVSFPLPRRQSPLAEAKESLQEIDLILHEVRLAYIAGHASARAESETEIAAKDQEIAKALAAYDASRAEHDAWEKKLLAEIAELRAKLAAMREPLWMLREEHEAETADLRARLESAEARVPRWVRYASEEWESLVRDGWKFAIDSEDDPFRPHLLMVQPVPLPETKL